MFLQDVLFTEAFAYANPTVLSRCPYSRNSSTWSVLYAIETARISFRLLCSLPGTCWKIDPSHHADGRERFWFGYPITAWGNTSQNHLRNSAQKIVFSISHSTRKSIPNTFFCSVHNRIAV
jgi:hypothetical protein